MLYKAKRKNQNAKAQVVAEVKHSCRVIKRQFGYVKTRFLGLAKNTARLVMLFAMSNLWMARRQLLRMRVKCAGNMGNARSEVQPRLKTQKWANGLIVFRKIVAFKIGKG